MIQAYKFKDSIIALWPFIQIKEKFPIIERIINIINFYLTTKSMA